MKTETKPTKNLPKSPDACHATTSAWRNLLNLIVGAVTFLGFFAWRAFRQIGAAMAKRGAAKVERILTYLASRQRREVLYPYIDEIGLAWNVLLAAWQGHENPYSYAFIRKYGKSPEKLIPMWAKREEELLKWLDGEHHIAPCSCAECELKRTNMGLAVQLSLNLAKTVPFPAAALTRSDTITPDLPPEGSGTASTQSDPPDSRLSPQPETPQVKKATA